ncbi:MAG: F0F1 ATP synthase subunit B' [Rhodospirillales bacterium]|nr:F0F1 ATP synthase subunit B' [Rhodospirillales bacterium]
MPQLDISTFSTQIVWLVITFAALFIIMWRVAVPRISDALEQRQKRMDDNLNKAAEFKKEAEAAIEAYEKSLAEAREAAHSAIADANAKLLEETAAKDAELGTKLKAMLSESEASIAKATEDAMDNVRVVAEEVASAAAERLLGDAVDAGVVSAAVDTATKARN